MKNTAYRLRIDEKEERTLDEFEVKIERHKGEPHLFVVRIKDDDISGKEFHKGGRCRWFFDKEHALQEINNDADYDIKYHMKEIVRLMELQKKQPNYELHRTTTPKSY